MNAYELADELQELDSKLHLINLFKSANMLRQQADRIAELEKQLNTPKTYVLDGKQIFDTTPQIKELSDEEIWEVIDNCFGVHAFNLDYQIALDEAREDAFDLVKTILKKASEK